jgi:hypothetical protein
MPVDMQSIPIKVRVEAGLALVLARARHFDVLSSRHETKMKEATTAVANYGISSFDTYTGIRILSVSLVL